MALTLPEFDRWWAGLNTEFPVYNQSPDTMATVGREWYTELRFQSATTVHEATAVWRRESPKRPHLSDILRLCGTIHARAHRTAERDRGWPDTNYCPCGCGGARWALYLSHQKMTRDKMQCRTTGTDPLPTDTGRLVGNDVRGVPVWAVAAIDEGDVEDVLAQMWA